MKLISSKQYFHVYSKIKVYIDSGVHRKLSRNFSHKANSWTQVPVGYFIHKSFFKGYKIFQTSLPYENSSYF